MIQIVATTNSTLVVYIPLVLPSCLEPVVILSSIALRDIGASLALTERTALKLAK